jgi:hypothetical protein
VIAETEIDEGVRVGLDVPRVPDLIEFQSQGVGFAFATGQRQGVTEAGKRFDVSREAGRLLQFGQRRIDVTKEGVEQPEFAPRLVRV